MATRDVVHHRDLPGDESFDHGTMKRVGDALGSTNQSVSVIEFAPGEAGPLSFHAEPVEELYFVVSGTFEFRLDDETHTAKPGTAALIRPGVHHSPRNVTDEPAILLVVQSPPAENTTYLDG